MSGIFRSYWLSAIRKVTAVVVIVAFIVSPSTTYAQPVLGLPEPGTMVLQSQAFVPVVLRAVRVRPDQPLVFDFVVDNGNTGFEGEVLKKEIEKIAKYFLATLTIPQKDLWVNLSPYEKDRIIADEFGQTEMGRDMLAQDYILKQLASSLVNPDTALGKEYWQKLYAKAQEVLGTTEIPMDTFNKVWIVPEKAVIYEKDNAAILGETHLKLMMEEDYLAQKKGTESGDWAARISRDTGVDSAAATVSANIMREVILPEIEKEVNTGKNFAPLRQMFSAIILATWYKEAVKDSLLSQMYEDKKKIAGVNIQDVNMREKIFDQYVAAYKKGVFNFIREDQDPVSGDFLPRKYFSGGVSAQGISQAMATQQISTGFVGVNARMGVGQKFLAKVAAGEVKMPKRVPLPEGIRTAQEASDQPPVGVKQEHEGAMEQAPQDDFLRTALTVTETDFQELVRQRAAGTAGVHLNVDTSRKFIPATEDAVVNWGKMSTAEKERLRVKQEEMFRKGQIGEIVMAGGEATRFGGPKTFVEIVKSLGEFLQVKINNLKWVWKTFNVRFPLYILSSEKRIAEFRDKLRARNYYGATPEDYRWYVQGTVDTFIPSDAELEANFKGDELTKYKRLAETARQANPDGIYRFKGERRLVPAGHFDAIASFIISGQLSDALKRGVEVMPVTNIDNLQAILKNDGMIAAFAESGNDFGFLLAEKNITYEVKEKTTGKVLAPKVFVRFRDNVLSFDGMNEFQGEAVKDGYKIVINQETKTLDVFTLDGSRVETVLKGKPETGGTLVQYTDENGNAVVTMKEGFELPADFDHEKAPFFNTNTIIMRLRSLLKFLDVTEEQLAQMSFDERSELVRNRLVKQIKANFEFKNHEVDGEYPDLGFVKDGKTKIPVVQLTRIMLQVVQIAGAKIGYIFAPRQEVFAPVKEPEDKAIAARNNEESLKPYLETGEDVGPVTGLFMNTLIQQLRRELDAISERSVAGVTFNGETISRRPKWDHLPRQTDRIIAALEEAAAGFAGSAYSYFKDDSDPSWVKFEITADPSSQPERAMEERPTDGGIDFDNALQSMRIERTGDGIKVHVDPAEILRIQSGGFEGLSPIIIEVVPIQGILPALGLGDSPGGQTTA